MDFSKYNKFWMALLTTAIVGLQQFLGVGDGETLLGIPLDQVLTFLLTLLGAFGVYRVANQT